MDDLAAALAGSFSVSNEPNTTSADHPRYAMYKCRTSNQSQEERRKKLLEIQKSRRFNFVAHSRNLADGHWEKNNETSEMENEDLEEENMDVEIKKPCRSYKNQLMFSEWLVEVPADFAEEWVSVLCPIGKRCLVVASRGRTQAFTKSGYCMHRFHSNLPGGNRMQQCRYNEYTILDCIFSETERVYYILDVMCWKSHPVYDSETEFRFYWLQSKVAETPEIMQIKPTNPYKFLPLPHFNCSPGTIQTAIAAANFVIDGLLFYHKRSHYIIGSNPLVVWLKPYMLPEIIGIEVPESVMMKKPKTYVNYEVHIAEVKETTFMNKNPPSMMENKLPKERTMSSKGKKKHRAKKKHAMDTSNGSLDQTESCEEIVCDDVPNPD